MLFGSKSALGFSSVVSVGSCSKTNAPEPEMIIRQQEQTERTEVALLFRSKFAERKYGRRFSRRLQTVEAGTVGQACESHVPQVIGEKWGVSNRRPDDGLVQVGGT